MGLAKRGRWAPHLPTTREEMKRRGWSRLDVLIISGDAYVDDPSFGATLVLEGGDLERLYALPFSRNPHPRYKEEIPAFTTVKGSITVVRGCAGDCSFCALAFHQGRHLSSRSQDSVLEEADRMAGSRDFRGTISDLGGPTANVYAMGCKMGLEEKNCLRESCLFPTICPNFSRGHDSYMELLAKMARLRRVGHVFVSSGIRHDLALAKDRFPEKLVRHHVSGHLKVAPEHASEQVQLFLPSPMTMATAMFWARMDPSEESRSQVARSHRERKEQLRRLFYYREKRGRGGRT